MQVQCFGLGMVRLDIRQESTRHSDVLDTITNYLGIGSYKCAQILLHSSLYKMAPSIIIACHRV